VTLTRTIYLVRFDRPVKLAVAIGVVPEQVRVVSIVGVPLVNNAIWASTSVGKVTAGLMEGERELDISTLRDIAVGAGVRRSKPGPCAGVSGAVRLKVKFNSTESLHLAWATHVAWLYVTLPGADSSVGQLPTSIKHRQSPFIKSRVPEAGIVKERAVWGFVKPIAVKQ
jgi:hypothetical protein